MNSLEQLAKFQEEFQKAIILLGMAAQSLKVPYVRDLTLIDLIEEFLKRVAEGESL